MSAFSNAARKSGVFFGGADQNGTNVSKSSSGILPLTKGNKRLEARSYSRKCCLRYPPFRQTTDLIRPKERDCRRQQLQVMGLECNLSLKIFVGRFGAHAGVKGFQRGLIG